MRDEWPKLEQMWHSAMAVRHTVIFNMDDEDVRGLVVYSSVHGVVLWNTALESIGKHKWFVLQATRGQSNYMVAQILDPARWKACEVEGVPPEEVRVMAESDKVSVPRTALRMKRVTPTLDLTSLHARYGFLGLTVPHMQMLARELGVEKGTMPSKEYDVVSKLVEHVLNDTSDMDLIWSRRNRKSRMDVPVTLSTDSDVLLEKDDMPELTKAVEEYELALQDWREKGKGASQPHGAATSEATAASLSSTTQNAEKIRLPSPASTAGIWTKQEVSALLPPVETIM
eukprot:3869381-Amphidinium_carterae.1